MRYFPFSTLALRRIAGGILGLLAPMALVSCGLDSLDVDALNAETLKRRKEVRTADSLAITKYIADSSFTLVRRQPSGLYILTRKPGTGNLPQRGQLASVLYKGRLLNNQVFDETKVGPSGTIEPFVFTVGIGQVIPGWDEGIGLMQKGEKAILLIPSELAYGPRGAGNIIPANAPLRFDVELTNLQ